MLVDNRCANNKTEMGQVALLTSRLKQPRHLSPCKLRSYRDVKRRGSSASTRGHDKWMLDGKRQQGKKCTKPSPCLF